MKRKSASGITLIALVVTIVVLLILAGITISLLFDGGILTVATNAKNQQEIAMIKEKMTLVGTNWTTQKVVDGNVTEDDFLDGLVTSGIIKDKDTDVEKLDENGNYQITTEGGYIFDVTLEPDGNVIIDLATKGPRIVSIRLLERTTKSMQIKANSTRAEGGKYSFYYKKTTESKYTLATENITLDTYTYDNLENDVYYDFKVVLTTTAGSAEKELKSVKVGELKAGTISLLGPTVWDDNGTATIKLQTTEPNVKIQYQIGSNDASGWKEYTGPISGLANGTTVYARIFDGINGSKDSSISIEDMIAPTIKEMSSSSTTNEVNLVVSATDKESGMGSNPTFTFYRKLATEADSQYVQDQQSQSSNYTKGGLRQGTAYTIKVEVRDLAGNLATFTKTITTKTVGGADAGLETGSITASNPVWSNGSATVQLSTTTGLQIQWQKNDIKEGGWTTSNSATGLKHNDTLYVRLSDGVNAGNEGSISIKDSIVPQAAKISFNTTSVKAGETITATVTLKDNETGINQSASKWEYNKSSSSIGTDETKYTGSLASGTSLSLKATTSGNWYLHILSVDNAGNKVETVSSAVTIKPAEVSRNNSGRINIAFVNKSNQPINASSIPTPKLKEGMTPIKWNGSTIVETTSTDSEWYNYTQKKWANVKTEDGSMWVWVPRYAYLIEYLGSDGETITGYSNSDGIIDTEGNVIEGTKKQGVVEVRGTLGGKQILKYVLHPAFTSNTQMGGWGSEIEGIWVAKFEASNSSNKIKVVPGVQSWRSITVNNIFTNCLNYNQDLNSHMMKNSEWGAVAYLSKSIYGKNEEITINNNSSYYTGGGSGNAYITNVGQSTTGNEYGIYDMSGGAWEYVASYVNNGHSYLQSYGASLVNSTQGNLKQVYSKGSSDSYETNYQANKGMYGDAVYETSTARQWLNIMVWRLLVLPLHGLSVLHPWGRLR